MLRLAQMEELVELVVELVVMLVEEVEEMEECISARVRVSAITQPHHVLPGLLMFSDLDYKLAGLARPRQYTRLTSSHLIKLITQHILIYCEGSTLPSHH